MPKKIYVKNPKKFSTKPDTGYIRQQIGLGVSIKKIGKIINDGIKLITPFMPAEVKAILSPISSIASQIGLGKIKGGVTISDGSAKKNIIDGTSKMSQGQSAIYPGQATIANQEGEGLIKKDYIDRDQPTLKRILKKKTKK